MKYMFRNNEPSFLLRQKAISFETDRRRYIPPTERMWRNDRDRRWPVEIACILYYSIFFLCLVVLSAIIRFSFLNIHAFFLNFSSQIKGDCLLQYPFNVQRSRRESLISFVASIKWNLSNIMLEKPKYRSITRAPCELFNERREEAHLAFDNGVSRTLKCALRPSRLYWADTCMLSLLLGAIAQRKSAPS